MRDRLRPLLCDHLSIMRGKYLPEDKIGNGYTLPRRTLPCIATRI